MSTFKNLETEIARYYYLKRSDLFEKNEKPYSSTLTGPFSNSIHVNDTKIVFTIFPTTIYTYVPEEDNYIHVPRDLLMISLMWIPKWSKVLEHRTFMEFRIDFSNDVDKIIKISARGGYLPRNPSNSEIMDYLNFQFKFSGIKKILGELKILNVSLV